MLYLRRYTRETEMRHMLNLIAAVLASVGVVFLKKIDLKPFYSEGIYVGFINVVSDKFFWVGLVLYGAAFLTFLLIINLYKISSAVPSLLGCYIVTTGIVSYFLG